VDPAAEDLIRRAYAAFNARDVESALATMQPDVDWPNAIEGGHMVGHDAIRAYWGGQFEQADPHVEPVAFRRLDDGRVAVDVAQTVRSLDGEVLSEGPVVHVYSLRGGLVSRMDIEEAP
jgi:uncharacterized protein (TIGR02246 family)